MSEVVNTPQKLGRCCHTVKKNEKCMSFIKPSNIGQKYVIIANLTARPKEHLTTMPGSSRVIFKFYGPIFF